MVASTLRPMLALGALFGEVFLGGAGATVGAGVRGAPSLVEVPGTVDGKLKTGLLESLPGALAETAPAAATAATHAADAAAAPMRTAAAAGAVLDAPLSATAGSAVLSSPPTENFEDVELRVMSLLATSAVRVLMESPLSCALKATDWLVEQSKKEPESGHAKVVALLSILGVPTGTSHHQLQQQSQHTMFGGIPWILLLPVVAGTSLVLLIQGVSMWSEYKEHSQKGGSPGEPYEADLGY